MRHPTAALAALSLAALLLPPAVAGADDDGSWHERGVFPGAGPAAEIEPGTPRQVRRIPMVVLSTDELANPHLYHPRVSHEYAEPPSVLPPPPSGPVVRPGEFEEMDSTIIAIMNYGPSFLDMWAEMVDAYRGGGHTYVVIPGNLQSAMTSRFDSRGIPASAYTYLDYPTDSIWIRDFGPEIVYDEQGDRHVIDAYYAGRPLDDVIPTAVAESWWISEDSSPLPVHSHVHELSGGNIMSDGAGTCFFSDIVFGYEKPSSWSEQDVIDLMAEYYGCEQMIVLNPICLDGTGHIDLYAKIMGPTSILLGEFPVGTHFDGSEYSWDTGHCGSHYPNDRQDQEDNLAALEASTNLDGDPWQITRIPMLEPYDDGGWSIYRSYLNSEIFNGQVAMPSYYDTEGSETAQYLLDKEAEAITAYETAMPGAIVVTIDADHIAPLMGAIHCISHEIPAEFPSADTDTDADSDADADTDADADGGSDAGADGGGGQENQWSQPESGCDCAAGAGVRKGGIVGALVRLLEDGAV